MTTPTKTTGTCSCDSWYADTDGKVKCDRCGKEKVESKDLSGPSDWRMSPLDIETLLHVYAVHAPFPRPSMAQSRTIADFLDNDLIVTDQQNPCGFRITGRGSKLVNMLCDTPLPEYCDPRFPSAK